MDAARRLLETTARSVDDIARRCGFGTSETLRRSFLRILHVTPTDYRIRFHAGTAPTASRRPA